MREMNASEGLCRLCNRLWLLGVINAAIKLIAVELEAQWIASARRSTACRRDPKPVQRRAVEEDKRRLKPIAQKYIEGLSLVCKEGEEKGQA